MNIFREEEALARTPAEQNVIDWAAKRLALKDFVVLDTETTGLDESAEIVQIAVIDADGRIAFQSLIKPRSPINENGIAYAVHKIGNKALKTAPCFEQVYSCLYPMLQFKTIIAYNADFDKRMVQQTLQRYTIPDLNNSAWQCAMKAYAQFKGEYQVGRQKWIKLNKACTEMDIPSTEAQWHDAAADALATYKLIKALANA